MILLTEIVCLDFTNFFTKKNFFSVPVSDLGPHAAFDCQVSSVSSNL